MPRTIFELPSLALWLQQLAGILPLSALIEFIDLANKLHIYELSGLVPLWNWPVTPAGARLLLSSEDITGVCCLDHVGRSAVLHCIDGRYGDWYPCSTPSTTRLCVSTRKVSIVVKNDSINMQNERGRKQNLDIFDAMRLGPPSMIRPNSLFSSAFIRYRLVSTIGWLCCVGVAIVSLMAGLYIGCGYLLLVLLTGICVRFTHGGKPRRLLDERPAPYARMVIATDSLNGSEWWAFYGGSYLLNSLLNKPLYRTDTTPTPKLLRFALRLLIVGQWVLAVGSCALQNWNALVISFWIICCALMNVYAYPPEERVQDWLRYDLNIVLERIHTEFSSRRSMLSALAYLNPDSAHTKWIDPILASSEDRSRWESALLAYMESGKLPVVSSL